MKNQYHYIVSIIVCTILFLSNASQLRAQNNPSEVVASFGHALSSWCNTNQVSYRERIDQLCSGPKKCRVEDVIHAEYQKGRGLTNYETFVLDSYLNMFQSLIPRSLNYKMSNVKVVGSDEMPDGTLTFITADITLSGTINKSVTDLFLVRNNKITGIYSYSSHMGFSHLNGSLIRALEQGRYQTGEYVNGYIFVQNEEGNLGLLDSKGDVIIPCVWHDMEFCGDFIMCYQYEPNNHHVCYDLRNLKRAPFRYCDVDASSKNNCITFFEGFASVLGENDKWGFLSENDIYYSGVEYVYDDASRFNDGYAYVTQDGINKIINKQFEIIIRDNDQYEIQGNFDEGLAPIKDRKNSKFGFVNKYGRIVISCRYEYVDSFSEGLCAVGVRINPNQTNNSRNWRYGYINKNGEKVIPTIYNFPVSFKNGHACVSKYIEAKGNGNEKKYEEVSSFISKDGRPLPGFDWEYHSIYEFQCGLARCEIGGKYGYIDMKGELVIPLTYTAARDFDSSGLAAVRNENDKWGCINKEGILVIPCIYEWVSGFYNGVAIAKKNDEIGLIDLYGNSTFNSKNKTQDHPINKTIDTDDE